MTITLYIPAVPVAQPRPHATMRNGHAGMHNPTSIKQSDGSRKPHPVLAFKATVKHEARLAYQGPPLRGPLDISAVFVFPRPQKLIWKTRPMPRVRHVSKPDRDNLDKSLLDALKGIVVADDCQVCDGRIQKFYADGAEQPHVEVTITELETSNANA